MALLLQGLATNSQVVYGSGTNPVARQSLDASLVVYEGGGKYQEAASRSTMFTGSTAAAGVNIPIYTSTTQQFVITNPVGSGVAAVLKGWIGGVVSGATVVVGFPVLCGANYSAASAAAPTGTAGLVYNHSTGLIGVNSGTKLSVLGAAVTVVAATWFRPTGPNVMTTTAGNTPFVLGEEFDGSIVVKPGSWVAIAANVAAFGTTFLAMSWSEIPVGLVN